MNKVAAGGVAEGVKYTIKSKIPMVTKTRVKELKN